MASSSASTFSSGAKLGDLFFEALGAGQPQRVRAAFGEVGAALEHFELGEGIQRPAAVHHFAGLGAGDRAFDPRRDGVLPGAGFAQLA